MTEVMFATYNESMVTIFAARHTKCSAQHCKSYLLRLLRRDWDLIFLRQAWVCLASNNDTEWDGDLSRIGAMPRTAER